MKTFFASHKATSAFLAAACLLTSPAYALDQELQQLLQDSCKVSEKMFSDQLDEAESNRKEFRQKITNDRRRAYGIFREKADYFAKEAPRLGEKISARTKGILKSLSAGEAKINSLNVDPLVKSRMRQALKNGISHKLAESLSHDFGKKVTYSEGYNGMLSIGGKNGDRSGWRIQTDPDSAKTLRTPLLTIQYVDHVDLAKEGEEGKKALTSSFSYNPLTKEFYGLPKNDRPEEIGKVLPFNSEMRSERKGDSMLWSDLNPEWLRDYEFRVEEATKKLADTRRACVELAKPPSENSRRVVGDSNVERKHMIPQQPAEQKGRDDHELSAN